ncbi:cell division protein FtsL [Acidihalobacter yilgarnensis]|uniref:Cell division protein FtsL n=1 Tax=Acidihalobacter yilgarnensis TaxID=2819280 RepID=A0A1D8IRI5_9GAMM|nr:cell division protein FtsL [Acidihalobacter yilgarnensis]AOU99013.1 cell division protein FtsL [Acidihalobacter yilgarnensis]
MNWTAVVVAGLALSLMGTALGVVYSTYETRQLFIRLERIDAQRDALNVEWGRLELEQSVWSAHSRVERIARGKLDMVMPDSSDTVYISP